MTRSLTEAIALIIFAALCVIGIILLAATGTHDGNNAAIAILRDLAFVAVGGASGVARQQYTNRR